MSIAQGRAADHRPRPARARSTTACRRRWRSSRSAASSASPSGRGALLGVVVELAETSELPPERLAEPIEALEAGAPPELVRLGLWVAREYCSTPSRGPAAGAAAGDRDRRGRTVRSKAELRAEILPAGEAALSGGERLGVKQRAVLEALRGGRDVGAASWPPRSAPTARPCAGSSERGLIATRSSRLRRAPAGVAASPPPPSRPELLPEQQAAVDAIVAALDGEAGAPRELLLHGVTGSGKTEVYLAAVEAALARGRGAIVLVPEIGLAPQAVARFRARLGDRFAVLHSALSAGERYDEWRRLRSGEASVCVGPRSAVFAPVRDLGLIVIDEEHDASYKQEGDPCYDARTVARRRADDSGAVLVAGTATPRPETWLELPRLELPRRVDGLPDAAGRAGRHARGRPALGPAARRRPGRRWRRSARAGAKAIVMINRRGFAPWLTCRSCGHHWSCPNCDVSLIVHRHSGRLVCHHCAHAEPLPRGLPRVRLDDALAGRRRHRADRGAAGRAAGADAGLPPRLRHRRRRAAPTPASSPRFGEAAERRPRRHPDGRQGPRLPGGDAERDPRRRRDPALPRLPRRGADLRDGRPARRAQRPRRGRGRGDRPDPGARARRASRTPPATTRPASSPASSSAAALLRYPPFSHLVRIVPQRRVGGAARERGRRARRRARARRCREDADLLGPAPMFRVRNRHRRRILIKAERPRGRPSPRSATRSSASPPTARCATSRSASTSTPSERRVGH